ncbi:MAG: DNA mismatch repair endonuclease MutL [Chloroflexi bacterium]|nr:DNA mismatch repair endonuclease MutL [Chloroflexota bacterium]
MPIRILAPLEAARIAAGEVVERPASVVKELLENALDAGARHIGVESQGGGSALILVADDGGGIAPDEVELAFARHATSKIASLSDLESATTLGFRGEALPSIAAVAEVELLTRTPGQEAGAFVRVHYGQVVERGRRACPPGTRVTVGRLFARLPARRKFLKTPGTENSHISQVVSRYSLAFPDVKFSLSLEGRRAFESPGSGSLREAALKVYGYETAQALLEVKAEAAEGQPLKIWGLVSPPSRARPRREAHFFVNRRWVQSRLLARAVEEAYLGLLVSGQYPLSILHLELPPAEVDVNIHPAKREVRFLQEQAVFAAAQRAVRAVLMQMSPLPQVRPLPRLEQAPTLALPLEPARPGSLAASPPPARRLPILRVLGQLASAYIIAEGPDGMYLIDQHAAHERVRYEDIKAQRRDGKPEVQGLLAPVTMELTPSEAALLGEHETTLAEHGFELEPFGPGSHLLRALPALLAGQDPAQALRAVLADLAEGKGKDIGETLAVSLACHGAVAAGQALTLEEMRELVRRLEEAEEPRHCPHGRPTMVHLSAAQLEREFGRR